MTTIAPQPPGELLVRLATAADAPALDRLINSAYRGDSSRAGWTTEADLLGGQRTDTADLCASIATPGHAVLVHADPQGPLCCVQLERLEAARQPDNAAYLGMLTVRPTRQASGYGAALLMAAEHWAQQHWGSRIMHLTVIAQRSELLRWYERRGYVATGEQRPFPYGNLRFGLPRRDDLYFLVLSKRLDTRG